jgi:hypothetical protein
MNFDLSHPEIPKVIQDVLWLPKDLVTLIASYLECGFDFIIRSAEGQARPLHICRRNRKRLQAIPNPKEDHRVNVFHLRLDQGWLDEWCFHRILDSKDTKAASLKAKSEHLEHRGIFLGQYNASSTILSPGDKFKSGRGETRFSRPCAKFSHQAKDHFNFLVQSLQ